MACRHHYVDVTSKRERKLMVTYWNDEELNYKTATMYMPDVTYSIHTVDEDEKNIEYNPFSIELIEY